MMTQNNSNKNFYSNGLSHVRAATDAVSNLLYLYCLSVSCVTEEGRIQTEIQRGVFFQVLKYLFRDHPSNAVLCETIAELEKDMLELNHEATIQWILAMTTYQPIVKESQGGVPEMPVMKKLFGFDK